MNDFKNSDSHPERNAEKFSKTNKSYEQFINLEMFIWWEGLGCTGEWKILEPDKAVRHCFNNVCVRENKR